MGHPEMLFGGHVTVQGSWAQESGVSWCRILSFPKPLTRAHDPAAHAGGRKKASNHCPLSTVGLGGGGGQGPVTLCF